MHKLSVYLQYIVRFVSVLYLAACDTGTQWSVSDTERTIYRASCYAGSCKLEVSSPAGTRASRCRASEHPGIALTGAGVLSVCHACIPNNNDNSERARGEIRPELSRCRPIICSHPRDCPPWNRGHTMQCVSGLCVENGLQGDRVLNSVSAAALCMAGAGPATAVQPLTEDRLRFARAACDPDGRCAQPVGCRAFRLRSSQ